MIPLPDDAPDTFRIYFYWAYTHRIFCEPLAEITRLEGERLILLDSCYIFGNKLMDDDFQDAILQVRFHVCEK